MSQLDPNQMNYYGAPQPPPNARPTTVSVIAILAIIFGSLGVVCVPINLVSSQLRAGAGQDPVSQAMAAHPGVGAYNISSSVVGIFLAIVELAAGIAALKLKPFGRVGLNLYAIAALVVEAIGLVVMAVWLWPIMDEGFQKIGGPGVGMARTAVMIGIALGGFLGAVWPALILFFMSRPHVKAAFAAATGGMAQGAYNQPYPPQNYPQQQPPQQPPQW